MILVVKAQKFGGMVTNLIAFGLFLGEIGYFVKNKNGWDVRLEKQELASRYVIAGIGARFRKSMVLVLLRLVDHLWPRKFMDSLIRLF